MLAVEIEIRDEAVLTDRMAAMRQWLDHRRFQPAAFRCVFDGAAVRCQVEFASEPEAAEFARAFAGRLMAVAGVEAPFDDVVGGEAPA